MNTKLIETFKGQVNNNLSIFLAHGATMMPFRESDLLVEKLKSFCSEIYSITIPGHGKAKLSTPEILDFEFAMQLFTQAVKEKMEVHSNRKFGFIGLSLGGMMGMRIEEKFNFAIYVGCGNSYTTDSIKKIGWFFSESTYQRFGMIDGMLRNHGKYWNSLLKSIKKWYSEGSILMIEPVMTLAKPSIFILAENDQPFDKDSIKFNTPVEIQMVSGDHFTYFSPKIFPETFGHISSFITNQGNPSE